MARAPLLVAFTLLLGASCIDNALLVSEPFPVADAGFDQIRYLRGAASLVIDLDGRASCDPFGTGIDDATWELVEGPVLPEVSTAGRLRGLFEVTTPGEYLVALRVGSQGRESPADFTLVSVREGDGDDVIVELPATDACGRPIRGD